MTMQTASSVRMLSLEDLSTTDETCRFWLNVIQKNSDLKSKYLSAMNSTDKVNKRERLLIRKMLWALDLWRLGLPETKETLQLLHVLKGLDNRDGGGARTPAEFPAQNDPATLREFRRFTDDKIKSFTL